MQTTSRASYMREWRRRNADAVTRNRAYMRARNRALTRLAHQFPETFAGLLAEELDREQT